MVSPAPPARARARRRRRFLCSGVEQFAVAIMRAERATVRHDLDFSGSARLEPETRARTHCIIVNTAPGGGRLSNNSYLLSAKDKHKAETKRLVSTVTTRLHVQQALQKTLWRGTHNDHIPRFQHQAHTCLLLLVVVVFILSLLLLLLLMLFACG